MRALRHRLRAETFAARERSVEQGTLKSEQREVYFLGLERNRITHACKSAADKNPTRQMCADYFGDAYLQVLREE